MFREELVKHQAAGDPRVVGNLTVEYEKNKELDDAMASMRRIKGIVSVKKEK